MEADISADTTPATHTASRPNSSSRYGCHAWNPHVRNPTCTAENCGSEVVRLIPAAGTFGVTEKCPGCLRNIPLVEGEPSKHARHEVHVPLPKLKRAVFSALRELKKKGVSFPGRIDVDLMTALEQLAL